MLSRCLSRWSVREPVIFHEQIAHGGDIVFEMSAEPEPWAYNTVVGLPLIPRLRSLTMLIRVGIRIEHHLSFITNSKIKLLGHYSMRRLKACCGLLCMETLSTGHYDFTECSLIARHQIISQGLADARTPREGSTWLRGRFLDMALLLDRSITTFSVRRSTVEAAVDNPRMNADGPLNDLQGRYVLLAWSSATQAPHLANFSRDSHGSGLR
ncbi:glycoside hydrolase family protein [Salix suchowensis]|nr:glycoside hydrolase family protein [Salix suchowensis]